MRSSGGVDTGWTFYTPFSTLYPNSYVIVAAAGVFIAGFSSILTGLNFIVTIHRPRAPGLTWYRLPLFLWSLYATSVILVLAMPLPAITLLLMATEASPALASLIPDRRRAVVIPAPVLVPLAFVAYIMILPGMGVINDWCRASRTKVFGYKFVAWCSLAIAAVDFLVWGHQMFVGGQSLIASLVFSFMSFIAVVPSAIKVFHWTATPNKGSIWPSAMAPASFRVHDHPGLGRDL